MALPFLRRMANQRKNPRLGRKCVVFWIPEARKTELYDRAKHEGKTVQALLNEIIKNYLYGRAPGPGERA